MAFIDYADECEANPRLREVLDEYRNPDGTVDNIIRIHGACLVAAQFNFVTRIACGLGVELEDRWQDHEIL
jgi:hypothetical protein